MWQDLQKMDSTGTAGHFTMIASLDDNAEKLSEVWHDIGELFGSSEDSFHLIRCQFRICHMLSHTVHHPREHKQHG